MKLPENLRPVCPVCGKSLAMEEMKHQGGTFYTWRCECLDEYQANVGIQPDKWMYVGQF